MIHIITHQNQLNYYKYYLRVIFIRNLYFDRYFSHRCFLNKKASLHTYLNTYLLWRPKLQGSESFHQTMSDKLLRVRRMALPYNRSDSGLSGSVRLLRVPDDMMRTTHFWHLKSCVWQSSLSLDRQTCAKQVHIQMNIDRIPMLFQAATRLVKTPNEVPRFASRTPS